MNAIALTTFTPLGIGVGVNSVGVAPLIPEIRKQQLAYNNESTLSLLLNQTKSTRRNLFELEPRLGADQSASLPNYDTIHKSHDDHHYTYDLKPQLSKHLLSHAQFDPSMLTKSRDGYFVFNNITLKVSRCIGN